jgi:hypothetical protein
MDNKQAKAKPDKHRPELRFGICFAFCKGRTNRNKNDRSKHKQKVDDSKKGHLRIRYCSTHISYEILGNRADNIEGETYCKLNMCKSRGAMPNEIVTFGKRLISQKTSKASKYAPNKCNQNGPSEKRVKGK